MNKLFYGDNLDILRHNIDDESVDLIYLDPTFKRAQRQKKEQGQQPDLFGG